MEPPIQQWRQNQQTPICNLLIDDIRYFNNNNNVLVNNPDDRTITITPTFHFDLSQDLMVKCFADSLAELLG